MTKVGNVYPRVDMTGGSQRFSDMEQQVLRYWDIDQTSKPPATTGKPAPNMCSMMGRRLPMGYRTMGTC